MVSFELGKEIEKDGFFGLITSVGQREILTSHEESNLRPSVPRSEAYKYDLTSLVKYR